jgi:hypothetical protein
LAKKWKEKHCFQFPFPSERYLSRSNGTNNAGRLYITERTSTTTTQLAVASSQPLGIGPEDLSHWPKGTGTDQQDLGVIWTVGEHANKRMLYSVVPAN